MSSAPDPEIRPSGEIHSFGILAARLIWAAFGPLVLLLLTYSIATASSGWLTALDLAFGAVVGLMLLARWIEQRSGTGTTLTGEPATARHWRRYVAILLISAGAIWVVANLIGNHLIA